MRSWIGILALAALLIAPLALPPAAAFIRLPSIQNRLIELALDQISSPGSFEITAESIEDSEDGATSLIGVNVSDGEGVWLSLERLTFDWRPSRLTSGELAITRLELVGLEVTRPPSQEAEPPELKPQESWQQGPFDWPRAPLSVTVEGVRIERAMIAEGVLPQAIRFDAEGRALDKGDLQEVELAVRRTDEVEGKIDLLMRRDFSAGTLRLDITADEAPGGMVAAFAGVSGGAPARLALTADGTVEDWRLELDAEVERLIAAQGRATLAFAGQLNAEADFTVSPGPELGPELRTVLGDEARLRARVVEQDNGLIEVLAGELTSPALRLEATGALATGPGDSDLAVSLVALAPLADLVEGVSFERFSFDGRVTGPQGGLVAEGATRLLGLATAPADVGDLSLDGRVAQTAGGAEFSLTGHGEGLRLDRLGPDRLGAAELSATGALDGDLLTLEDAALDSRALTVGASGRYDLAAATGELNVDLATPAIAPLAAAYDVAAEGAVEGGVRVTLAPGRIDAALDAALTGFAMDRVGAGRLALTGTVTQTGERIAFDLDGSGEQLRLDRLDAGQIGTASIAATGALDGDLLTLERATLESRALTAGASGRYDLAAASGELSVDVTTPAIAPLAAPYDLAVEGAVRGEARITLAPERIAADFDTALTDFAMEQVAAGRLGLSGSVAQEAGAIRFDLEGDGAALRLDQIPPELTREASFAARGAFADNRLDLAAARLAAPLLTAEADGTVGVSAGTLAIDYTLETPELSPVAAAYGVEAGGALSASGRAEGPFATLGLAGEATMTDARYAGQRYGTVRLNHDVSLGPAPEGRLELALADGWLGEGRAATGFRLADERLSLTDLEARIFGGNLAGAAEINLADTLIDGQVDLSTIQLAPLGRLAGSELAGTVGGRITLTARDGRQDATARLDASGLGAPGIAAARARLALTAADALGTPRLDLTLEAGGVSAGPAELETLTASARGPLAALEFSAETAGTMREEALTAALGGRANLAAAPMRLTLGRAEATLGADRTELRSPVEITVGAGGVAAEGLDLALPGGGGLTGDAAQIGGGYTGDLRLDDLLLATVGRWTGAPLTAGRLDATARFDTRPGRAGAELSARAREVAFEGAEAAGRALELDLDAGWDGARLDSRVEVRGGFGEPFRASLALPLRPRAGGLPRVPAGGALDGRVAWSGRIGELWALVPVPGHLLDGQADIDLTLAGTLDAPAVSGRAEVSDGQYQNLDAGTILTDLTLATRIEADRSVQLTLEARDGAAGRVRSEASLRLGEQPIALDVTATAEEAVLVRRDDVTAALSGEVALAGTLTDLALTGALTVDKAEVRLVNATPPEVVDLEGIRLKGAPDPDEGNGGPSRLRLDLSVEAPRDIFVRGRGLDSEWGMSLSITGTATTPIVSGEIERIRGRLSLLGRVFQLERGRVVFDGGRRIDPELDVYLEREDHDIRGGIVVSGRASAPELGFSSSPALPEDEVLPRLLFGQSRQSLTGAQALQLAGGLATLMGGGGGPIAALREMAGLDVLRVEGQSVEDAAVTVGRNVGEDIFIGARQGLGQQGSAVTVEVEVFNGVTVDSEVTQEGNSNIGIMFKKDF